MTKSDFAAKYFFLIFRKRRTVQTRKQAPSNRFILGIEKPPRFLKAANRTVVWQAQPSPASLGFPVLPSARGRCEIYRLKQPFYSVISYYKSEYSKNDLNFA